MRNYPINPLISFLILSVFIINGCENSGQRGNMPAGGPVQTFPVLELQPRSLELTSVYPATLEGLQTVEIRPRVQGYITKMYIDEGDWVNEGDVLFSLNSEEFEQEVRSAKASVQASNASVSTAEDEVKRLQSLVDKEIISNYQLQTAKNQLQSSEATLAQAEARLTNARVNLGYTKVKSPVSGIISTIPYRIGSLVSSSSAEPLTVVSDISQVYAYFSMSERELLEMAKNVSQEEGSRTVQQQIADMEEVNLILADNSVYEHTGELKLASGFIDTQTGAAAFRAVFPNPNQILRSGGSAKVQIPFNQEGSIIIPKKSTYEIQNQRFVYTVTDSSTVKSRNITVLSGSTKQLFVVTDGLSPNEKIVTTGIGKLQSDMKINPQTVDADSLYQALSKLEK